MKNPLNKRLPRELKEEFAKYLVIFLLMTATIGMVSGFLVADGSMIKAYNESFEKYNIENGNFKTDRKINKSKKEAIEKYGISIYENFYIEEGISNGSTLRIFKNRDEVNLVCLMEGRFPEQADEIAIDRMYADNNDFLVGGIIETDNGKFTITGLIALPDYSCLFSDNNDSMFDSVKFGVAVVSADTYETFDKDKQIYCYSWKYDNEPADDIEEKEVSEELMDDISTKVKLTEYIPRYQNQAINFTGEDMGSDKAMITVLLYIIIVIMAFVFGVTISNTIVKEANVIGTLRASGYTRGELIRHYMLTPLSVTLIGAVAGNILGYTYFKDVFADMYYGSYSLTTYVTVWNAEAFVLTTLVPIVIMAVINFFILSRKLKLSPLKFIRRDLTTAKQQKMVKLPYKLPFFMRFRLRVIMQNVSNYIVLFIGIIFANLLLMFGLLLPSILVYYQNTIEDNMICNYQYMLKVPMDAISSDSRLKQMVSLMKFSYGVQTDNEDAEKFSAYSLQTMDKNIPSEEIILYGAEENSKYINVALPENYIYISSGYAMKYGINPGDTVTLKEKYENKEYSFKVDGIYDYEGSLSLFMNRKTLNEIFDLDRDYFAGYFSNTRITDIDDKYISSIIDLDELTKITRQLMVSMGNMMDLLNVFSVIMYMILIYLLSKVIIEKNAHSISMTKILGYTNMEISRLYIISTSIVVIICLIVSLPLENIIMGSIYRAMVEQMIKGWIPYSVDPVIYVKMFAIGVSTYAIVAALEYRKIKKVPMDEALKNVE